MRVLNIYTEATDQLEALLDLYGFVYNVEYIPSKYAKSDHFGEVYSTREKKYSTFSFFDDSEFNQIKSLIMEAQLVVIVEEVEEAVVDYQQQFEDDYPIVEVGNFNIVPPWKKEYPSDKSILIIAPSTGFGTGQSPTTQLCLNWISTCDFENQKVLDFGSGSGILAIAAAKCGASHVTAFEIDLDACENAKKNVEMNECEQMIIVTNVENGEYDALIMNVTAPILYAYFDEVWSRIKKIGYLSGIHENEYDEMCHFLEMKEIVYTPYVQEKWYGFEVKK